MFGVTKKRGATVENATKIVNMIIGSGSSILPKTKLKEAKRRARKLHTPRAVAANRTGKKYELATKLILKAQETPNFANR